MPSHIIHIKIAQDINKKLRLDNDSIMLGSVLPDLTVNKDHGLSHFQYKDEYPFNLANADEFIKKYPNLKDDISIGYIIHLLTDKFYNDWYYKKYRLKGISTTKEFKHNLFASYDEYLLKHYQLIKFSDYNVISKIPNYKDLYFDKQSLEQYIINYNDGISSIKNDLNYTIENQDELNNLYNDCLTYIFRYFNVKE